MSFDGLISNGYGAILADPPWRYEVWSGETAVKRRSGHGTNVTAAVHYQTMSAEDLAVLPNRIQRLVAGPYLELFARQKRSGWDVWGNQTDKLQEVA